MEGPLNKMKGSSWTTTTKNSAFKSRFKLHKKIGEIQHGGVYAGRDTKTDKGVAIKYLDKQSVARSSSKQTANEIFEWEFAGLKLCDHPFIHDAVEVMEDDNKVYLITELMECDLYFVTDVCDVKTIAPHVTYQIATAVQYMHERNMCHRDIKPENVFIEYIGDPKAKGNVNQLVSNFKNYRMKLADFGFWSSTVDPQGMPVLQKTICGSEVYTAPEIKLSRQTGGYDGKKADVWSLAVTMFVVQINFPPWEGCKMDDPYYNLWMSKSHKTYWKVIETHAPAGAVTPAFKDLFTKMCEPDPSKRVTIADIFKHPYLANAAPTAKKALPTPRNQVGDVTRAMESVAF